MPYAPPANTQQSAGLGHNAVTYYDRLGLDKLFPMLRFAQVCESKPHPKNSGRTGQFYRFDLVSHNSNPASEGTIGTSIPLVSSKINYTIEEYNDFTSTSQLIEETDIVPWVEEMVEQMSYRAAKSIDVLARTEIDSNSSALVATEGAYFSAADARANVAKLKAINVLPRDGGEFMGVIHPYVSYDLMADNTAGGFIDIAKYADNSKFNGEIGKIGGVRFVETTEVGTSGSAPNVLYYTYIFGKGGVAMCDLSGVGPNKVVDPANERFQTSVSKSSPSPYDPTGTLGTFVGYRFVTAFKTLDSTNLRFKIVKADASLV